MDITIRHLLMRSLGVLLAALIMPVGAFSQVPLETRELRLQGATSGTITLRTPTVTTSYNLSYPATQGSIGSLLYLAGSDGSLAWSGATAGDRYIPMWDTSANAGAGGITWTDPGAVKSPLWSINGNNLSGPGKLGTTSAQGVNIITNGKILLALTSTGGVTINGSSQGGVLTTIGRSGHTTKIDGILDADGTTSIDGPLTLNSSAVNSDTTSINTLGSGLVRIGGSSNRFDVNAGTMAVNSSTVTLAASSGLTITGATTINATGSASTTIGNSAAGTSFTGPVKMGAATGSSGEILVSQGAAATPQWQGIGAAVGIRKAGNTAVTSAVATPTISAPGLAPTDAIIITLQGSGSAVVATVTDRDDVNDTFKATFSGSYTGVVNFLIIASR